MLLFTRPNGKKHTGNTLVPKLVTLKWPLLCLTLPISVALRPIISKCMGAAYAVCYIAKVSNFLLICGATCLFQIHDKRTRGQGHLTCRKYYIKHSDTERSTDKQTKDYITDITEKESVEERSPAVPFRSRKVRNCLLYTSPSPRD